MDRKMLVFLGGTVGQNPWRKEFLNGMEGLGVPRDIFFDPVVADWNQEAQDNEERAKKEATHLLFYIGSPMQDGPYSLSAYSMVEATMGLYDQPKSLVVFNHDGIEAHALKSIKMTERVLRTRFPWSPIFSFIGDAMDYLEREWKVAQIKEAEKAPNEPVSEERPDPLTTCQCGLMRFEHTFKSLCENFVPVKK